MKELFMLRELSQVLLNGLLVWKGMVKLRFFNWMSRVSLKPLFSHHPKAFVYAFL